MIVKFNTDNHIEGSASMSAHFESLIQDMLQRFDEDITRVEIFVKDVNAGKEGTPDKNCTIEARLKGMEPLSTSAQTDEVHHSVKQAGEKMKAVLNKIYEKRQSH